MDPVVVGVSPSSAGTRALDRALLEARRSGRSLSLVRAWEAPLERAAGMDQAYDYTAYQAAARLGDEARRELADQLAEACARLRCRVDTCLLVDEGPVHDVLRAASRRGALLVIGQHERSGALGALLGSTTRHLLATADCPVMVVPSHGPPAAPYARVVVGVDGSEASLAALRWASGVAHEEGCALVAVQVAHMDRLPGDVERFVAEARLAALVSDTLDGVGAACLAVVGSPTQGLLDAAHENDLLVVGAHSGHLPVRLGSVASACVRRARCVVVVVPPPRATS